MRIKSTSFLLLLSSLSLTHCGDKKSSSSQEVSLAPAGGTTTIQNRSSGAFTLPAPNLDSEELALHNAGDRVFESEFVSPPATVQVGLGPTFNNTSCRGCHVRNGRGMPVIGGAGLLRSHMLLRLSLEKDAALSLGLTATPGDGPIPVPGLGGQLQDHSIFGAEPEAKVLLTWEELPGRYPDGTPYSLRRPLVRFESQTAFASWFENPALLWSIRQSPPVFGLGLLEAVAEADLLTMADPDDKDQDGISGQPNYVWDPSTQSLALGRFGWKASAPNLLVQSAGAFAEDMGVLNPIFPGNPASPEIDQKTLEAAAYYVQTLAVPNRDTAFADEVKRGARLFAEIQCTSCHRASLQTDEHHPIAALRNQSFAPYTDLLLHDMGDGLADGRADFRANGREWRTAPLWGIGLAQTVLPQSAYLHDGRARTLEEAILWHGGEAAKSQERFQALSREDRAAVLRFLRSL